MRREEETLIQLVDMDGDEIIKESMRWKVQKKIEGGCR